MKTITLKQIGFQVTGMSDLTLWGGQNGCIEMKAFNVNSIDENELLSNLNDNGFGCQSINGGICDIWELYENDYREFSETIAVGKVSDYTTECYYNML